MTFDRVAASGGIAFTLFAMATIAVAPAPPAVDAPASEIHAYLTEHHARFGLSVITMALAVLGFTLAIGYIHRRLTAGDTGTGLPSTFLAAGTVAVCFALAGVLLQGVLARYGLSGLDDSTLLLLHRTWNIVAFMGPPLPLSIALLLAGARTLSDRVFPRWLGWVALVSALGGLTTALINIGTSGRAPFVLDTGSFLLSCVWVSGIGVHALLSQRAATVHRGPAAAQS